VFNSKQQYRFSFILILISLLLFAACGSATPAAPVQVTVEVPVETIVEVEVTRLVEVASATENSNLRLSDSDVIWTYDSSQPVGSSQLIRTADSIYTRFAATSLTPDQATTLWFILFNYPEKCGEPFACTPADLGSNRPAMGDFLLVDGAVIAPDGTVSMSGSLPVGDTSGSGLSELPEGCVPGYPDCGSPVGIVNPEGALVIVALHSHGPKQSGDVLEGQLNSYLGGCEQVIGTVPGGFAADVSEVPDASGECATIQVSPHAP
jgi:hypothetical protein